MTVWGKGYFDSLAWAPTSVHDGRCARNSLSGNRARVVVDQVRNTKGGAIAKRLCWDFGAVKSPRDFHASIKMDFSSPVLVVSKTPNRERRFCTEGDPHALKSTSQTWSQSASWLCREFECPPLLANYRSRRVSVHRPVGEMLFHEAAPRSLSSI